MTDTPTPRRNRYEAFMQRLAVVVLVLGLSAATGLFIAAAPEGEPGVEGPYLAMGDSSKRYRFEVERVGGKTALYAMQLGDWFDSLWQGRRLAATVAVISVGGFLLLRLAARLPSPDE